jgi:hypothetical protein
LEIFRTLPSYRENNRETRMAWALGIVILILIAAFSVYQVTKSNDAAMRVDAWRSRRDRGEDGSD